MGRFQQKRSVAASARAERLESRRLLSGPGGSFELSWGQASAGSVSGIGVDGAGNVYSVGEASDVTKRDAAGNILWTLTAPWNALRNRAVGHSNKIGVDAAGNVTVVGQFLGEADFDPGPGTTLLRSSVDLAHPVESTYVARFDSGGQLVWARAFTAVQGIYATAVAVDGSGNVYTTGWFVGTMDFDPGAGTYELTAAGPGAGFTSQDVFVSKLDASGNFVWARAVGASDVDVGSAIGVDGSGNVVVGGYFHETVDFDPGPGTSNLIATDGSFLPLVGTFVMKLDAGGNYVWARQFSGKQGQFQPNGYITVKGLGSVEGLAIDPSGNVVATGQFLHGVDFDPGPGVDLLDSARQGGGNGAFLVKLDPSGNEVWARAVTGFGETFGSSAIHGWAVTTDASGNVYGTGDFGLSADFDPGPGSSVVIASDISDPSHSGDVYVVKLDAAGNYVTHKTFAGFQGIDRGLAVAATAAGNLYLGGDAAGVIDLYPSLPGVYRLPGGALVAKFAQVPTGQIVAVAPAFRHTAVSSVDVLFSEALGAGSFTLADLVMTRGGVVVPWPGGVSLTQVDATTYRVSGLDALTAADGAYALVLDATGVVDVEGNAGAGGSSVQWAVDNVAPTVVDVVDVTPDPYDVPGSVPDVRVTFSEPIDVGTFSAADVTLTRDGAAVSLGSAAVGLELVSGSTYRITGLGPFLVADGTYGVTVRGDVADAAGNAGSGSSASDAWLMVAPPTMTDVVDVSPDPRTSVLASIDVRFSEPIDLSTFGVDDLALTFNGSAVALGAASGLTFGLVGGSTYRVSGFQNVVTANGAYTLTVSAAGVTDLAGHAGVGSASDSWTLEVPLTVLDVVDVAPDPRNTTVGGADVVFNHDVDPTTFNYLDVVVTRDGFSLTLDSRVVITQLDARTFRISGLEPFTGVVANYTLTVNAEQVKDTAGKPGAGSASDTWVMETTRPSGGIASILPNPRTAAVATATASFNEPVTGLTIGNFTLTRGGVAVPLTGATLTPSADAKQWLLGNLAGLTGPDGAYVLTLSATGVTDLAGNALSSGDTESWSMDGTPPVMTLVTPVVPSARSTPVSSVDFTVTDNVGVVSLFGNTSILSLTRDGVPVTLSGVGLGVVSGTTYRISGLTDLTSPDGSYVLTVDASKVRDTAGNPAAGSLVIAWTNGRVSFAFAQPVAPGVPAALSGQVADPPGVPFGVRVDWGDGQVETLNLPAGTATFGATHTYARLGLAPVRVDVAEPALHADWATRIGGGANDPNHAVARDAAGNLFVVGEFGFTMDADPGSGVATVTNASNTGTSDVFFAKYDAAGQFVYARGFGGTGSERGEAAAIDASGNLFVSGQFQGAADFDSGAGVFSLTSAGGNDAYVAEFTADGQFVTAWRIGGAGNDDAPRLLLTPSGNVVVAGRFAGTVDFDPGVDVVNLADAGNGDLFVAQYTPAGALVWARRVGGANVENLWALAVDAANAVYVGGDFQGTIDADPGTATANLGTSGGGFAVKLDSGGNFVWGKLVGTTSPDTVRAIALSQATGRMYLSGRIATVPFVMQWDANGNTVWDRRGGALALALQPIAAGGVYGVGTFNGTVDFDPAAATTFAMTSAGSTGGDAFLTKFAEDGTFAGALRVGGTSDDSAESVVTDAAGGVYVAGYFNGAADFDPGARALTRNSGGATDGFVTKLSPAAVSASRVVPVRGGERGVNGPVVVSLGAALTATDATNAANYELRWAGADGAFGGADDVVIAVTPAYTAGASVVPLGLPGGGLLAPGNYRLTVFGGPTGGLRDVGGAFLDGDADGTVGGDFVATFAVAPPPAVATAVFSDDRPDHTVTVVFTRDVATTLTGDDLVLTTAAGAVVGSPRSFQYAAGTRTATWTFAGGLADGDYVARIAPDAVADAVGNALDANGDGTPGDGMALTFYHLTADANHDRAVDFNDLVPLAQHYNVSDGLRTKAEGDFTGDGNVDFNDLVVLAQRYNTQLPPPAVGGAPAAFAPVISFAEAWTVATQAIAPGTTPKSPPVVARPLMPVPRPVHVEMSRIAPPARRRVRSAVGESTSAVIKGPTTALARPAPFSSKKIPAAGKTRSELLV